MESKLLGNDEDVKKQNQSQGQDVGIIVEQIFDTDLATRITDPELETL